MLLHINPEAVIPAPYQVRGKLQQASNPENTGFRVKPGMTNKGKGLLTPYTSAPWQEDPAPAVHP